MPPSTPRDFVGELLDVLRQGLAPFVARELERFRRKRGDAAVRRFLDEPQLGTKPPEQWHAAGLLKVLVDGWNGIFGQTLASEHRGYASELRTWRNRWAHQEGMTLDDAYRVADTVESLARGHDGFSRVHPCVREGADVPDEQDARLVVLPPEVRHVRGEGSRALAMAKRILEERGSAARTYRNALAFLAADEARAAELEDAVRMFLAWSSIVDDAVTLDLTTSQRRQAEEARNRAERTVDERLKETYCWLLWPHQDDPLGDVQWAAERLQGSDDLYRRAYRLAVAKGALLPRLGGAALRMQLDRVPLWRGNHVAVSQLAEDFARYTYLPRLHSPSVLAEAVEDGVRLLTWREDGFAFAESFDESSGRYRGLVAGQSIRIPAEALPGLLVKPEVAEEQIRREQEQRATEPAAGPGGPGGSAEERPPAGELREEQPEARPLPRRFHGSVTIDPLRAGADAGLIAKEVIAHLASLPGAQVTVTLEIDAQVPGGVPEDVVRVVTENCRTLRFQSQGFERE